MNVVASASGSAACLRFLVFLCLSWTGAHRGSLPLTAGSYRRSILGSESEVPAAESKAENFLVAVHQFYQVRFFVLYLVMCMQSGCANFNFGFRMEFAARTFRLQISRYKRNECKANVVSCMYIAAITCKTRWFCYDSLILHQIHKCKEAVDLHFDLVIHTIEVWDASVYIFDV